MLTVYVHPRCSTVKKALKWLDERGIKYQTEDLTLKPIERSKLEEYWKKSNLPIKKFFNTSGVVYKSLGLSEKVKTMSDEECLTLLATDGLLVKRPIITDSVRVTVGFKEGEFEAIWGN